MDRRWAWVEVDLDAVSQNVRTLESRTPDSTIFMAVVKADGYGHGVERVARAALAAGADRLGVATVDEAVHLRESGFKEPLHVLSEPPPSSASLLVEHGIISTVARRDFAVALGRSAASAGVRARFHLKVDTGMNRTGVRAEEAAQFAASLKDFPGLDHEGTFTHFATAEVPGDWDFSTQLDRFEQALAQMKTEGAGPGIVHAANSAATILHPETHYDMVRCGIAMYGLHPGRATYGAVDLRPAMTVRAQISLVKRIGMGEGVSYGLTWRAVSPTTVATVPLGYADGIHRILSNRMEVLVGGVRCRQIGRVTMDQIVIEIPRELDVAPGEDVIIVGRQGAESISMDEIAEHAETINYEMACAFGMRMERFYR